MITYKEVDSSYFEMYDTVSMNVEMNSIYKISRIDNGLGGMVFEEIPCKRVIKDLSVFEHATDYEKMFDITNWRFYMAFDGDKPVGAMTIAGRTEGMNMLGGRTDACVLWDIRVSDEYKHQGIGKNLLKMGITNAGNDGYSQMIIECQSNNVTACKFYAGMGAKLSKIDMYAYYMEPDVKDDVMLVWYLDL